VPALDVNVDTRNGVVTLFGIVPTADAKNAAEADARKVSGVTKVANELQVVPREGRKAVARHDDAVKHDVEHALAERKDFGDVGVDVKDGVVRLSGTVPSEERRLDAAITARRTGGVRAVQDDLRIRSDRADAGAAAAARD